MNRASDNPKYMEQLDESARIFMVHVNNAMQETNSKGLDPIAGSMAATQMAMHTYAELIDDHLEAIRQLRNFLSSWEADVLKSKPWDIGQDIINAIKRPDQPQ